MLLPKILLPVRSRKLPLLQPRIYQMKKLKGWLRKQRSMRKKIRETEKLQNLQNELSQKLYAQTGAGTGTGSGEPGGEDSGSQQAGSKQGGNEEEVIDAEFEAKDDDNK